MRTDDGCRRNDGGGYNTAQPPYAEQAYNVNAVPAQKKAAPKKKKGKKGIAIGCTAAVVVLVAAVATVVVLAVKKGGDDTSLRSSAVVSDAENEEKQTYFLTEIIGYNNEGEINSSFRYEYEFDDDGNEISITAYTDDKLDYIKKYSSSGDLIEWISYDDGENVSSDHKYEYTYSTDENLLIYKCYLNDECDKWIENEYDDAGNLTMYTEYFSDGSVSEREWYEYDNAGNVLVYRELQSNGMLEEYKRKSNGMIDEYIYDSNGNILQENQLNSDGSLNKVEKQYEYEYDKDGNILMMMYYYNNGSKWYKHEYTYDDDGNMLSDTSYNSSNDGMTGKNEYTYDDDGNMVMDTSYNQDNEKENWSEYAYDNKGNVIEEVYYITSGDVQYKYEYTYDVLGNMKSEKYYFYSTNFYYTNRPYEETRDASGNVLEYKEYDSEGTIIDWYVCTYDSDEYLSATTSFNENGEIAGWHKCIRDARGNQLATFTALGKNFVFDDDDLLTWEKFEILSSIKNGNPYVTYEYKYDKSGNILQEVKYDSDGEEVVLYDYAYENIDDLQ